MRLKDITEAVVNYPGPSGVPASQREVGTNSHREYVSRMTGVNDIRNFINSCYATSLFILYRYMNTEHKSVFSVF
mgnify:CR=1 FL=1